MCCRWARPDLVACDVDVRSWCELMVATSELGYAKGALHRPHGGAVGMDV